MLQDVKVLVNFGEYPFIFAEGRVHREGADKAAAVDVSVMNRELPFPPSNSEDEEHTPLPPPPPPPPPPNAGMESDPPSIGGEAGAEDTDGRKVVSEVKKVETAPPGPPVRLVTDSASVLSESASTQTHTIVYMHTHTHAHTRVHILYTATTYVHSRRHIQYILVIGVCLL